ncbi:DHH family phosphoesterase [Ekhidna sp. To15]|uniref:DHH family phosphoesterase n=1 Tax=Ekhidna sp. To15 TaxID=3395267 RepID=UPI003F51F7EE
MKDTQALKDFLQIPKKIVITTHANPDADALGSSLGLHHFLVSLGHDVYTIVPNSYPDFLEWMPGNSLVINYEKSKDRSDRLLNEAELLFCLDFSGFGRIKEMKEIASSVSAKVALVDHHLNPEIKPDFDFWNDKSAATAELIFDLIVDYSGLKAISVDVAECLYAGVMTDTGSFKHNSTTSKVHRMVADLIDLGADVNKVSRLIYDTNSLHRLKFLGHALAEKLQVIEDSRVAYFVIEEEDFKDFRLKQGDTEGLVNYALSIKGIVVAAIIIERENEIKLSFRSIGDFAVNKFAEEYFSGGGHKNASGGMSELSLEETEKKFKELIEKDILKTRIK